MHLGVKQQYKPSYQVRAHIEIIVTHIPRAISRSDEGMGEG